MRRRRADRPLAEIVVVMALKLTALAILYWLFFGPAHRPAIDAAAIARHWFSLPAEETPR